MQFWITITPILTSQELHQWHIHPVARHDCNLVLLWNNKVVGFQLRCPDVLILLFRCRLHTAPQWCTEAHYREFRIRNLAYCRYFVHSDGKYTGVPPWNCLTFSLRCTSFRQRHYRSFASFDLEAQGSLWCRQSYMWLTNKLTKLKKTPMKFTLLYRNSPRTCLTTLLAI